LLFRDFSLIFKTLFFIFFSVLLCKSVFVGDFSDSCSNKSLNLSRKFEYALNSEIILLLEFIINSSLFFLLENDLLRFLDDFLFGDFLNSKVFSLFSVLELVLGSF
jgi:hypothetical protein